MAYRDRCMAQLGRLLNMDKPLTDEQLIALGRQHLMEKELRDWGEMRAGAIAEEKEATRRIKLKLDALQDEGRVGPGRDQINEVQLADLLGVDRMTVRAWLGKNRKPAAKPSTALPVDAAQLS